MDAGDLPPGLREEYLAGMRTVLGALAAIAERLAIAGNDREALEALQRESHKIHGSAGSYGFMDASRRVHSQLLHDRCCGSAHHLAPRKRG